jgi:hypothetical protein
MTIQEFLKDRYKNKDVHIVGSGPSLKDFDYSYFDDKTVIAINHAFKKTNHDCVVYIDKGFARIECPEISTHDKPVLAFHTAATNNAIRFDRASRYNTLNDGKIFDVRSSGCTALSIAIVGGASKIYLHGFDYCTVDGVSHSTDGEFKHRMSGQALDLALKSRIKSFERFPITRIFNCSQVSAIPYFKKIPLPVNTQKKFFLGTEFENR